MIGSAPLHPCYLLPVICMIFLNNAATSFPKPDNVRNAVKRCLKTPPFLASRRGYDSQQEDIVFSCRKALAALFNIQNPERIVFTSGATESLCLAIFGLELRNAHVITTSIEHNSREWKAIVLSEFY